MGLLTNYYYNADIVDPNRDGYVSLQEYMAFMISKETENVQSSEEIENAFRAITNGERPYVTKEELYAVSLPYLLQYWKKNSNETLIISRTLRKKWPITAFRVWILTSIPSLGNRFWARWTTWTLPGPYSKINAS